MRVHRYFGVLTLHLITEDANRNTGHVEPAWRDRRWLDVGVVHVGLDRPDVVLLNAPLDACRGRRIEVSVGLLGHQHVLVGFNGVLQKPMHLDHIHAREGRVLAHFGEERLP